MCLSAAPVSAFAAVSPDVANNIGFESNVGDSSADYVVDDLVYENYDNDGAITKTIFYKSGPNKGTLEYQGYGVLHGVEGRKVFGNALNVTKIVVKNDPNSNKKFTEVKGFLNTLDNVEEIVLPDSVEIIHRTAFGSFYGDKLKKINIPSSLREIDTGAFRGLNIESLSFPTSFKIKTTDTGALADCKNLTSVSFPPSVTYIPIDFFHRSGLSDFDFSYIQDIADNAFYGCKFTELKLDSVKTIGKSAFDDNDLLKTVVISDKIESIGAGAFNSCDSLYSITIKSKNCKIIEGYNTLCAPASQSSNGTLIKCYANSTTHKYAMKHGYRYELLDKPADLVYGDANLDGKVTLSDALTVSQYIANEEKYGLSEAAKKNADCYNPGDGITGNDASAIQWLYFGVINKLPYKK